MIAALVAMLGICLSVLAVLVGVLRAVRQTARWEKDR